MAIQYESSQNLEMTDHVLTIQRVLTDGAIAKTITCRSGRVAVLRSNAPEKLYDYELALRGRLEDEHSFRLSFDGASYNPSDHLFLGFDQMSFQGESTVQQLLISIGLSAEQASSVLLSHGLQSVADVPLSRLTHAEAHCVALLHACLHRHPLMVLHDPFIPIPESSREVFAQTIANSVWKNKTIVVVVCLSWRPDHWIDNDLITRVQIDQTQRRATVGIGAENPLTELARQLRKEKKSVIEQSEKKKILEEKKNSVFEQWKEKIPSLSSLPVSDQRLRAFILIAALIGTSWFVAGDVLIENYQLLSKRFTENPSSSVAHATQAGGSNSAVLDLYPADIRDSVVSAFYGTTSLRSSTRHESEEEPQENVSQSSYDDPVPAFPQENFPLSLPPRPPSSRPSYSNPSTARDNSSRPPIDAPPLPPEFEDRMRKMMEGKDPAVQERIEMMMRRMHENRQTLGGR